MEITCPNCYQKIKLPRQADADLLLMIRNQAFEHQVSETVDEKCELIKKEYEEKIAYQKEYFEQKLKEQEEMTDYYKDLKIKASTKLVGETLEQHCMIEFEKIRATAFPHAYFEKDNDCSSGTKGDFIFRECDSDGNEIISIMFEMKNEMDTTKTKHKNEHFFAKLDKDRRKKKCEYAVLVSLLESENELYNMGIVDVSHRYEKMYVIRPQFFLVLISVLRNAALRAVSLQQEAVGRDNASEAISEIMEKVGDFKTGFAQDAEKMKDAVSLAINDIDQTISRLEKVRQSLTLSARNLDKSISKADTFFVNKL